MLGHDDPETLKNLCDLTGINLKDIPLNDSKVFETKLSDAENAKMINSADKMQEVLGGIEL